MDYDVFISYAHVDDEPWEEAKPGWVKTFLYGLRKSLAREVGRRESFSLWVDYELRGNQSVTPAIMNILNNSKMLVLFLSKGYLASTWCQQELANFVEKEGAASGRIFVVELSPHVPPDLVDLKRYQFWYEDDKGRLRTLATPEPLPTQRAYYDLIQDMARDLALVLSDLHPDRFSALRNEQALRQPADQSAVPDTAMRREVMPPSGDYKVFVATGDKDVSKAMEFANCLRRRGISFALPLQALPDFDPSNFRASVLRRDLNQNLKKCDAVLMPFDTGPPTQLREHIDAWWAAAAHRKKKAPKLSLFQEHHNPLALGVYYPRMTVHTVPGLRPEECVQIFVENLEPEDGNS